MNSTRFNANLSDRERWEEGGVQYCVGSGRGLRGTRHLPSCAASFAHLLLSVIEGSRMDNFSTVFPFLMYALSLFWVGGGRTEL
jgi:hypothetical protein